MTREQRTEAILYEIAASERIVWQGKPVQGVLATWYDVIFIPIRIAIFTGLCFLFYIKLISETLSMFVGFLIFFFCYGTIQILYMKFIFDPKKRAGTLYAITSSKVILISPGTVMTAPLIGLTNIASVTYKDGTGKITIGTDRVNSNGIIVGTPPSIDKIKNVKEVCKLLLLEIKKAKSRELRS